MANSTCDKCVSLNEIAKPHKDLSLGIFAASFMIALAIFAVYFGYGAQQISKSSLQSATVLFGLAVVITCGLMVLIGTIGLRLWDSEIVGKYLYAWKDDKSPEGYIHTHLTQPMQGWNKDCLLRLRIGGWFKTNRIYAGENRIAENWQIVSCWDGDKIMIRDRNDEFYGCRTLVKLFEVLEHESIGDFLFEARIELNEADGFWQDLERIIIQALLDQKSAQRSKSASKIRMQLLFLVKDKFGMEKALHRLTQRVSEMVPDEKDRFDLLSMLGKQIRSEPVA